MNKNILFLITAMLIVAACGKTTPEQQLATLKAERDQLNDKIRKIEAELEAADTTDVSKNALVVSVDTLRAQPFMHYIEVQGQVDGDENVSVAPKLSSTVRSINVKVGQIVKKGQILATLEESAAQVTLQDLRNNLKLVTDLYEKQARLWEQKIGSEVQYLQAKNNKESLEQKIAMVEDLIYIKAPINGKVEEVNIKIGELASPQLPLPAFRIVSFNKLKVKAQVAEAYAPKINPGDALIVFFPDLKTEVSAKVDFASDFINTVNRTFEVSASLTGTTKGLKANMVAVMKINDYKNPKAIVVPVNYIQYDQQGSFVIKAVDDGAHQKASKAYIKQGLVYNGLAEISDGLAVGDRVVSAGFLDLEDGEYIRIAKTL